MLVILCESLIMAYSASDETCLCLLFLVYRTAYQQTCIEYIKQKEGRWKIDLNYCLLVFIGTTLWTMWAERCKWRVLRMA